MPYNPTPEELQRLTGISPGTGDYLLAAREAALRPLFDAADGVRADLLRRGWSPNVAEAVAGTWLHRTLVDLTVPAPPP